MKVYKPACIKSYLQIVHNRTPQQSKITVQQLAYVITYRHQLNTLLNIVPLHFNYWPAKYILILMLIHRFEYILNFYPVPFKFSADFASNHPTGVLGSLRNFLTVLLVVCTHLVTCE